MHKAAMAMLTCLALFSCDASHGPQAPEPGEGAVAGLRVAVPRFAADQKQGGQTVLDLKRQGCEELLGKAAKQAGALSVEVSVAVPAGADDAQVQSVHERIVSTLPEQPAYLKTLGTGMYLSTNEQGVRALCASPDTRLVHPRREYEAL